VTRASLLFPICALLIAPQPGFAFAKLSSETAQAFDRYVAAAESKMTEGLQAGRFLHVDSTPDVKAKLRAGEVRIETVSPPDPSIQVSGGLLQDWLGMMFIPNASIAQVKAVLQDYANYKNIYQPKVIDSKEISHHGDHFDIFLRLYEKHILTVVLNTNYHVRFVVPDLQRMYVTSNSTRIAELKDPKRNRDEEKVGDDTGFLWRLNSYWRFEEADGGVYAECEAISLSRDLPLGLAFLLKGFIEQFPKESMMNTLRGTREAVLKRQ